MKVTLPNPENEKIKVWIDGTLYPREEAKISVFDSVVQGGDAVWEGLRIYDSKIFMLEEHIKRMRNSAHILAFNDIPSAEYIRNAIFKTLQANGMRDKAHLRVTLTRGKKVTSGMNPKWNQYGSTLIILAEWKPLIYKEESGLKLITSSIRRNNPQYLDSKIHHNNLLNNILAKIEANYAGVDGSVMLDMNGFLSETNSTNIFMVRNGILLTPFADSCLPGITRALLLEIADENKIPCQEKNISISEMYTAEEMFVTGTEGALAPVFEVDGRKIGNATRGSLTQKLQTLHTEAIKKLGVSLPF